MKPQRSFCAWLKKDLDHSRGWHYKDLRIAAQQELPNLLHSSDRLRDRNVDAVDRSDVVGAPPDWKRSSPRDHSSSSVHADTPVRHLGRPPRRSGRQTEALDGDSKRCGRGGPGAGWVDSWWLGPALDGLRAGLFARYGERL